MALKTISGPFSATWGGNPIGQSRNGFTIRNVIHEQPVNADMAGDVPVDAIEQGEEVFVDLDFVEYTLMKVALKATTAVIGGGFVNVGLLRSALCLPLVLTPIGPYGSSTSATSASLEGSNWTFNIAVVADNIDILLSSKLRQGPIRFKVYPNTSNGLTYVGPA
jgi:hypothetical protein